MTIEERLEKGRAEAKRLREIFDSAPQAPPKEPETTSEKVAHAIEMNRWRS